MSTKEIEQLSKILDDEVNQLIDTLAAVAAKRVARHIQAEGVEDIIARSIAGDIAELIADCAELKDAFAEANKMQEERYLRGERSH